MTEAPPTNESTTPRRTTAQRVRRRRTVALAASVVLGTALLLWAGDWVSRLIAQSVIASSVQEYTGAPDEPTVRIRGPIFLTQVIRGRYDHVEIDMESVSDGPLRLQSLHADLFDVYLPFHDVLVGDANQMFIGRSTEEAIITWNDLNQYLTFTGRAVRFEPAADGEVRLTATVDVLGTTVSASADANIAAADGEIAISPRRLRTDTVLDSVSEIFLSQRFTFVIPLDPLPFGQKVSNIEATDEGLVIQAGGTDVLVTP